jgi:hypothetical protein
MVEFLNERRCKAEVHRDEAHGNRRKEVKIKRALDTYAPGPGKAYVLCVRNTGYLVSLELRKIYETRPDVKGAKHDLVRVVDESGEDYLYPSDYFVPVELSKNLERLVAVAR